MRAEPLRIRLTGTRPLLMHSSRLVDPLDPITIELDRLTRKRDKTAADHEQVARVEWHGGLWLRDNKPCIPAEAIEATFVSASKTRRKGTQAKAGFSCAVSPFVEYDGPAELSALWDDKTFRLRCPVNIHGARVMRTRPRFPNWSVTVDVEFFPSQFNRKEVIEILEIAGFEKGLGDRRPKFGRFSVEQLA